LAARQLREQIAYLVVASVGTLLTAFSLGSVAGIAAGLYYLPHSVFSAAAFFLLADRIVHSRRRDQIGDLYQPAPAMANAALLGGSVLRDRNSGRRPAAVVRLCRQVPVVAGGAGASAGGLDHAAGSDGGLFAMIALARAGSLLFFRVLPPTEDGEPRPAGFGTLAAAADHRPAGARHGLTVAAGPIHAYTQATAEQLLQPYHYVHAVLGGRP
jgi:multicomponent K+:H+ antiporter subunit D